MNNEELVNFPVNMQMPQSYVDALIDIATENNMTAEQFARNCVADFLKKSNPRGLTSQESTV
tara:strand:+ start:399 stop:584 length:186 start_codon:yes stop_codon:yes gene_type:complete